MFKIKANYLHLTIRHFLVNPFMRGIYLSASANSVTLNFGKESLPIYNGIKLYLNRYFSSGIKVINVLSSPPI